MGSHIIFHLYKMSEEAIQTRLQEIFRQDPFPGTKRIKLSFRFKDHSFETVFRITHSETMYDCTNGCITITINRVYGTVTLDTSLSKNDGVSACFTPRLVSGGDIKTIDVLQVLKTRMALLFPNSAPLKLSDEMSLNISTHREHGEIMVSLNRVLRGEDAYYERYGYRSEKLNPIKSWIRTLAWDEVGSEIQDVILSRLTTPVEKGAKFVEVMKRIPIQEDIDEEGLHLSYQVWGSLVPQGFEEYSDEDVHSSLFPGNAKSIWMFTLDPESEAWKTWSKTVQFTDLVEMPDPGKPAPMKSRRRKMRRKGHSTRRR
jgi:hypothetical protein